MKRGKRFAGIGNVWMALEAGLLSIAIVSFPIRTSAADSRIDAEHLVEKARMAFDRMVADPNL